MKSLVQKMREQRMFWVELDSTHKVRVLPPTDLQVMEAISTGGKIIDPANLAASVHDWVGFTEEDFLGKGIGATDALPLDREALNEWLSLNVESITKIAGAIQDELLKLGEKKREAEKN